MPLIALLDQAGVLTGYEEVEAGEVPGRVGRIPVPDGCDLVPGKYRWDGKSFIPINQNKQDAAAADPDAMRAIAHALMAIRDGEPLPPDTLQWLHFYQTSFDNRKG
jgi:hypothetical protein